MVLPFDTITKSAGETQKIGEDFGRFNVGRVSGSPLVVCLWGDLGSGKTTFVQGMARGLGIQPRLLSPTFIIVRHYRVPITETSMYHLDLYRFSGTGSVNDIGLSDMIHEPGSIVIIEWPERLGTLLPLSRVDVRFEIVHEASRRITGVLHG